jgi:hypothetical protein
MLPFAPWCLCFSSMLLWGAYPLFRRFSAEMDTAYFVVFHFAAEIALAAAVCASVDAQFFTVSLVRAFENEPGGAALLLAAGTITSSADVIFMTALKRLPSSIYPMMVGTTMTSGITISYLIDGSPSPTLLFSGLAFTVLSVFGQALAAAETGEEETSADDQHDSKPVVITIAEDAPISPDASPDASSGIWVYILVGTALLKSGWVPLTLVGRLSVGANTSYFLYICGRALFQPLIVGLNIALRPRTEAHASKFEQICDAGNLRFAHVVCGLLSGVFLSGGYYAFWIGSEYLHKSAALSIGYSCPLVTLLVGFALGDFKNRSKKARRLMGGSAVLFAVGLAMSSASGAVTAS